jgi:NADH-quinone oxidoreductase subunit M
VHSYSYVGVVVVLVAALNGIAIVQAYFKIFTGARHVSTVPLGIGVRERWAVLTLAALIFGGGLWPQPWVASRRRAAEELLQHRDAVSQQEPLPAITLSQSQP